MDGEQFDDFLDDATHAVDDLWEKNGGESMKINEKYALKDLLAHFFERV